MIPAVAHINRIGTANPPHPVHAAFVEFVTNTIEDARERRLFTRMVERSGIGQRFSYLQPVTLPDGTITDSEGFYGTGEWPTTAARMLRYRRSAPDLACAAIEALDPAIAQQGITHLVVASCTGFVAPGLDQLIVQRLGLDPGVERTLVGLHGLLCRGEQPAAGASYRPLDPVGARAGRHGRAVLAAFPAERQSAEAAVDAAVRRWRGGGAGDLRRRMASRCRISGRRRSAAPPTRSPGTSATRASTCTWAARFPPALARRWPAKKPMANPTGCCAGGGRRRLRRVGGSCGRAQHSGCGGERAGPAGRRARPFAGGAERIWQHVLRHADVRPRPLAGDKGRRAAQGAGHGVRPGPCRRKFPVHADSGR